MKRLIGFDFNGWHDFTARNWLEQPGQETLEGSEQTISGGIGSVVVKVIERTNGAGFIGGIQALKAPHGRGGGWGVVGPTGNRHRIIDLLRNPGQHKEKLKSALQAMADTRHTTAVLSIPDTPDLTEEHQEDLLEILRMCRTRRKLLVWRPVLALLAALRKGLPETVVEVGVIGHVGAGLTSQRLILRSDGIRTPERRETGMLHKCNIGIECLLERARSVLLDCAENPNRADHVDFSENIMKLALGYSCKPEALRKRNGTWEVITPPEKLDIHEVEIPPDMVKHLEGCDVLLFETPVSGHINLALKAKLQNTFGVDIFTLDPQDIALGALDAARRLDENIPVYFDFLPKISTIVQDMDGARNYDLIPKEAVLPAGQIYRSTKPAKLGLLAGMTEIKIYLHKETVDAPRCAIVKLVTPPHASCPVDLHVEQVPASGRARLTLTSVNFSGPIVVDWDNAEELEQSWEWIIDSQKPTLPTIPNRLVLNCGMENWTDQLGRVGLLTTLDTNLHALIINWQQLANKISARPIGNYSVSSDGILPEGTSMLGIQLLNEAIHKAEEDVKSRLDGATGNNENHSLRFLTWLFQRCPAWVVKPLINALDSDVHQHVFLPTHQSRALLYQGLGRIARDPIDQMQIFKHLLARNPENWKRDQLACAAFLLSRTDTAPQVLSRKDVDYIGKIVVDKMLEAIGTDYTTKFSYAPYLMVGLLRWRMKDPWALVAGKDLMADRLLMITQRVIDDISLQLERLPHLQKHHDVLIEVCAELEGKGSNPDILFDLQSLTSRNENNE